MKFSIHPVTAFAQNCSLIWCEVTAEAALIDPGGDPQLLLEVIKKAGVRVTKLLLTHGHIDHVGGAVALARALDVPIVGPHRDDAFLLDALPQQAAMFGFPHSEAFQPAAWLDEDETVQIGEASLQVLHCPGHTPGHVVFFDPQARQAYVGDVLFQGSIGRTDFPRGNHRDLIDSIRNKLFPLGDDVAFVPGHGPMSTLGRERRSNPYVAL